MPQRGSVGLISEVQLENDHKRLAWCAKGFGRNAIGGLRGKIYIVTDASDDDLLKPRRGILRFGATRNKPLWIIFACDMVIKLQQELMINSYKTIDARGANVHIAYGAGLTIQFVQHVIIHNLHIHDIQPSSGGNIRDSEDHWGIRTQSDGDGVSIFGSSNVWVDHLSMSNCVDGLIDAVSGSTAITISNCHLTRHNDVILLGHSDSFAEDAKMQVTVAYNHFGRGLVQRMPRCRWGFFHVVNNDYTHWIMYAIGGSQHPTIISQGNRFLGPPNRAAKEVTHRDYAPESMWKNWNWRSEEREHVACAHIPRRGACKPRRKEGWQCLGNFGASSSKVRRSIAWRSSSKDVDVLGQPYERIWPDKNPNDRGPSS
ncbi:pectate lyase-like [Canna indica]|uniref:Pectate lyase n=1 Tax=Canna indica TaxID=4628 RepID=A0AAQ3QM46_9LILI|nr:pectate lyase-like [Canna indica]